MNPLAKLFELPTYIDSNLRERVYWLHAFAIIVFIALSLVSLIHLTQQDNISAAIYAFSSVALAAGILLLRRGYLRGTLIGLSSVSAIAIFASIWLQGEKLLSIDLVGIFVIMALLGVALGQRSIGITSSIAILAILILFAVDHSPASPWDESSSVEDLITVMLCFLMAGGLQWLNVRTATQAAREAQLAAEENFQRMFSQIPIGLYRTSVDAKPIRINPALIQLLGYQSEENLLSTVSNIATEFYVQPTRRQEFMDLLERDGFVIDFESEAYKINTHERMWISETAYLVQDNKGNTLFYEGSIQDITERRAAQLALLESRNRLQTITDNLPVWIAYIDNAYKLQFVNERYERIWERPRDQIIGRSVRDIVSDESWQRAHKDIERALAGQRVTFDTDGAYKDTGEKYFGQGTYIPHVVDQTVVGFFVLIVDVTEQRKAETAMKSAQRLESLGIMAGGVAHDFNNLLVAMLGQSSLAMAKLDEDNPAHRHIGKVVTAARRASDLTRQLLAYSGHGHFEIREINLNSLINDNVHLLRVAIPKHVRLHLNAYPDLPAIFADAGQIQQVVMNLIINAGQAIEDPNGLIAITTSCVEIDETSTQYWEKLGNPLNIGRYVLVRVQDNGVGMPQETLDRIFEPFYSTKVAGHGLGLSAVLGIVRGHNGGIHVTSAEGDGTCFELVFPIESRRQPIPTA